MVLPDEGPPVARGASAVGRVGRSDPFALVGQVLDGHLRVDRYVGQGGFSVVYQATHIGLGEPMAVKCLKLPAALGAAVLETFVRRFRDESRIQYKLSQGNLHIVRSIASGTFVVSATRAVVPYIVLEWLEGRSLAEDFAERQARGMRGRSLEEVIRLLDSAVEALAHAHAQGVVHRDINPGNLFLAKTATGIKLKVLDFGVAKILTDSALIMGPRAPTMGNVRLFAPAYGAPEQFDERVGTVGPWTDVYALGLLVLQALVDRAVIDGEDLGEFTAKVLDRANRPSPRALGVPMGDEVERVLLRAVAVDPAERPRDAGDMWGMLKHAMSVDGAASADPARLACGDGANARESMGAGSEPPEDTLREGPPTEKGTTLPVADVAPGPSALAFRPRTSSDRVEPRGSTLRLASVHHRALPALVGEALLLSEEPAPPVAASAGATPASPPRSTVRLPCVPSTSPAHPPAPDALPSRVSTAESSAAPPIERTRRARALLYLLVLVVLGMMAGWLWVSQRSSR